MQNELKVEALYHTSYPNRRLFVLECTMATDKSHKTPKIRKNLKKLTFVEYLLT